MHRRVWFLAAAAAAVLVLAGSAAAMRTTVASSSASTLARSTAAFQRAFPNAPRTPAARAAKLTAIFALEQEVAGFNLGDLNENAYYAAIVAGEPIIRGDYVIDNNGNYKLDLASKVVANKNFIRIYIRKDANWYWVGHKLTPVTAQDYVYTWKQTVNPHNNVAGNTGLINMNRYKINNKKEVTFYWRTSGCTDALPCGAFADYRDLFGYIYPSFALKGKAFNSFWTHCVCGYDGNPISDGPYYMSHYIPGSGMQLNANPKWYGGKAKLSTVYFRMITDTNSEIQAMKGGEVDAISPSPEEALAPLVKQKNLTYSAVPSFTQEHWDIQNNGNANVLLKNVWMRQAIMEGMNRQSLIDALYPGIAPGLKPLNNAEYEIGTLANGKYAYFSKTNFNAAGAITLLKSHGCTGGPSAPTNGNTHYFTCGGHKADFRFDTTTRASREASGAIFQAQLAAVGIEIDPTYLPANPNFFADLLPGTNGHNGDWDLAEYAWIGGPDPSGFDSIYKTGGGSNYKNYSNATVDSDINKGDVNFNATTRTAEYEDAASRIANDIGIIPLYAPPQIFVKKRALMGATNNPTSEGPTWDIQQWHW